MPTQNQCTATIATDDYPVQCQYRSNMHTDGAHRAVVINGDDQTALVWSDDDEGATPHTPTPPCGITIQGHLGEELSCALPRHHDGEHQDGLYRWNVTVPATNAPPTDTIDTDGFIEYTDEEDHTEPRRCPATTTTLDTPPLTVQCHMANGEHMLHAEGGPLHVAKYVDTHDSAHTITWPDRYRTDDTPCQATMERVANGAILRCDRPANSHVIEDGTVIHHATDDANGFITWPDKARNALTTMGGQAIPAEPDSFHTWDPLESTCRHASLSIL